MRSVLVLALACCACRNKEAALEDRTVELAWHDLKATITGRVPVGWIASGKGYFGMPDGGHPMPMDPFISYSFGNMSCDGECDDGDMQASMIEMWEGAVKLYAQVSYNSGNERTDNMKLDVKTLEQGAFTDGAYQAGKYMAVKITRPRDAQDLPAYLDGCGSFVARPDGRSFDHLTRRNCGREGGSGLGTSPAA